MAPKTPTKTSRKATTVNKPAPKPKKTYTTAAGAQQYVRGNTPDERRNTVFDAKKNLLNQEKYNKAADNALGAAGYANESRTIRSIVGAKKAKTDSTVRMYDRMERDNAARSRAAIKAKKGK